MSEKARLIEAERILEGREALSASLRAACSLAASMCDVPVVLVNIIGRDTTWTIANFGFEDVKVQRCYSFCDLTMKSSNFLEIPDVQLDPRTSENPFVIGNPFVRFYAGQPLITAQGQQVGALAIFDYKPRILGAADVHHLKGLATIVSNLLESSGALRSKIESDSKLEEERDFVNAILENISEGVVACDGEGNLSLFNRAAREFHGLSPHSTMPQSEWASEYGLFYPDGLTKLKPEDVPLVRAFQGERVSAFEMVVKAEGAPIRRVHGNAQPVFKRSGEKVGAVVTMHDVTDLKAKEELLIESKFASEAATRAKSDFLANMSHEIRTPLNGILGMSDLVAEGDLSLEQREQLSLIQSSSRHLLNVVNDILDISKIEAGKLDIEMTDFNFQKLFFDVIRMMSPIAHKKGINLIWSEDLDNRLFVRSDEARIKQVLLNIVGNAIKFTSVGEVRCSVRFASLDEIRTRVDVEVADTGIGISKDAAEKLFQPFTQADTSTSRRFGGTGLGLSISKQLINMLGGSMSLKSEVGKGSVFGFHLVVERVCAPQLALTQNRPDQEKIPPLEDLRVLLAEDNAVNRKLAIAILKKIGIQADVAENGLQAVEAVRARHYDIVLMDCQMPEMDGFEASKRIRLMRCGPYRPMAIIALTANALKGDKEKCLASGMDDYLAKPFKAEQLIAILGRWRALQTAA